MSLPALELTHLPPTSTFEELRAICSAKGVVYSLSSTPGALPRALVLFGSTDAAAAARDLLHGSDWGGGAPLEVKEVPEGPVGWIAAEVPGYLPPGATVGSSSQAAPQQQQQQQQRVPPPAPLPPPAAEPPSWAEAHQEWVPDYGAEASADWPAEESWGSSGRGSSDWQEAPASSARPSSSSGGRRSQQGGASTSSRGAVDEEVSDVRLMLRNLNPDTQQRQVVDVCSRYGKLVHALKHSNTRYARVQFARPEGAAAALSALNEKLVPELNDHGCVFAEYAMPASAGTIRPRPQAPAGGGRSSGPGGGSDNRSLSDAPASALWVGNIEGSSTSEDVRSVFGRFGPLLKWQLRVPSHASTSTNSQRFAIVCFKQVEDAQAAMAALNRRVVAALGGHPLKIKFRTNCVGPL